MFEAEEAVTRRSLMSAGHLFFHSLVNIILPPKCPACRALIGSSNALCAKCWKSLWLIEPPYCERLGIPFTFDIGEPVVSMIAQQRNPLCQKIRSACLFEGTAKTLTYALKYNDHHEVVNLMSRLMLRAGKDLLRDADIILPVPLHWTRLLHRRFNQSALLAGQISKATGVPLETRLLLRNRRTRQQVGLNHHQRRCNVADAFIISKNGQSKIKSANVLLIDDVITTGATLDMCAKSLVKSGSRRVDALTFAMVADPLDFPL